MTTKAPSSIATRQEPVKGFDAKLEKARTLMGGTEAMRDAGTEYLPKAEGESKDAYATRKSLSYLFNGFRKTVWDFAGRVFQEPVTLSDDAPEVFKEWATDIDLQGRDLSVFARQVFEAGTQSGIEYLLVDAPRRLEGETVAQAREMNNRPYIVHLRPEAVLGWKTERINNRTALSQFRFKERIEVQEDEFKSKKIDQIRVLDLAPMPSGEGNSPGNVVRSRSFQQNKEGDWEQVEEDAFTDMPEITVIPFYANRVDFFAGEPPLDDLADLNIAHWQSQSDQRNILHFTRVPILFARGVPENTEIKLSSASLTSSSSENADLKFVEHSGSSIGAGQRDLEHLEFQMQTMGLQFMVTSTGRQTATGEVRSDRKETSRLAAMADSLQDALEQCFKWMGEYQGVEFNGSVNVHKDFSLGPANAAILNFLIASTNSGKLSRESFWRELRRYGLLSEDFDPEEELRRLDSEQEEVDGLTGVEEEAVDGEEAPEGEGDGNVA